MSEILSVNFRLPITNINLWLGHFIIDWVINYHWNWNLRVYWIHWCLNKTSKIFETKLVNHDIIGSMLKHQQIENIFAYLDSNGDGFWRKIIILWFKKITRKVSQNFINRATKFTLFSQDTICLISQKNIQQIFFTKKQTLASASMQEQQQMVLNNE